VVHEAAAQGYQKQAATYQRGRPTYHPDLVARVAERYADGPLVELGAGTGILTAALVDAGLAVTAVEPVEAMRSTLAERVPGARVLEGTAEAIPLDDACAATVLCSQSFHWFDAPAALDEVARVLRPGGHLLTVWNVRDEEVAWVAAYTAIADRYAGDAPRYRTFAWRRAIDADARYALADEWQVENPAPTDAQGVVERMLSTSFIAALDADEQARVADEVRAVVADLGPRFAYPYRSELQAWQLVAG